MQSRISTILVQILACKRPSARLAFSAGISAAILMASPAQAAEGDVLYNFFYNSVISEGKPNTSTPPTTGEPVMTALFSNGEGGTVTLKLATNFSVATNFLDDIGFNFNGTTTLLNGLAIHACTETQTPGTDTGLCEAGVTTLSIKEDKTSVQGGGDLAKGFDFLVDLPPPPGEGGNPGPFRLGGLGESITLTLKSTEGDLTAANFDAQTSKGYYTSAHIQGLTGGLSTNIVGVPPGEEPPPPAPGTEVPGPLPLLGAAAAFGYSRKLRTRIRTHRPLEDSSSV